MGLGALPDDAEWITIYYTDRESARSMDMVGVFAIFLIIVSIQYSRITKADRLLR